MDDNAYHVEIVPIRWHDMIIGIPKWIVSWYKDENITLDDAYLDWLYSQRMPPIIRECRKVMPCIKLHG